PCSASCHYSSATCSWPLSRCFLFRDGPPTTATSPLSLHDALPISSLRNTSCWQLLPTVNRSWAGSSAPRESPRSHCRTSSRPPRDRKSTRLNSSHVSISYAVFCLKKKTNKNKSK